jgi:hypothetical protein
MCSLFQLGKYLTPSLSLLYFFLSLFCWLKKKIKKLKTSSSRAKNSDQGMYAQLSEKCVMGFSDGQQPVE